MKILRIDSSTTGDASVSREVADAIIAQLTTQHADAEIITRDLVADPLPHLDAEATAANRGGTLLPEDQAVLDEFLSADLIVVGAPMYNFSVPSQLKVWLDRLAVPRTTFGYGDNGPEGYAGGRKIIIASSRGGAYGDDSPFDFQEGYLKTFFGFLGITDVSVIRAEGVGSSPERRTAAIAAAKEQIASL